MMYAEYALLCTYVCYTTLDHIHIIVYYTDITIIIQIVYCEYIVVITHASRLPNKCTYSYSKKVKALQMDPVAPCKVEEF